jgi:hypothetical protein
MFRGGAAFASDAGSKLIRAVSRKIKDDAYAAERAEQQEQQSASGSSVRGGRALKAAT